MLNCSVYGTEIIFSVKIEREADVEELQQAIFKKKRYSESRWFAAGDVTLYLSRKREGEETTWLKSDATFNQVLKGGKQGDCEYVELLPGRKLIDDEYFGVNFQLSAWMQRDSRAGGTPLTSC
ncbi:unnamed protein product [Phytophthora lilii]|uniref:Unnamed protein product n=1 Tax=Phytophthora lilii TaxID=2077276 RepID=A0A9W6TF14_9STRA|nr:unnamed protein product [Phytophthora lilii]